MRPACVISGRGRGAAGTSKPAGRSWPLLVEHRETTGGDPAHGGWLAVNDRVDLTGWYPLPDPGRVGVDPVRAGRADHKCRGGAGSDFWRDRSHNGDRLPTSCRAGVAGVEGFWPCYPAAPCAPRGNASLGSPTRGNLRRRRGVTDDTRSNSHLQCDRWMRITIRRAARPHQPADRAACGAKVPSTVLLLCGRVQADTERDATGSRVRRLPSSAALAGTGRDGLASALPDF